MKVYCIRRILLLSSVVIATIFRGFAQNSTSASVPAVMDTRDSTLRKVSPSPMHWDTTFVYALPPVIVEHKWHPKYAPMNTQEKAYYWRRIRDVKRVVPYVDLICDLIVETYEYMETLPNKRAKRKHLKRFEKELKEQYMPEMKKLTLSQGQLMMKLIDREIGNTPYQIIKAFYGSFRATFYSLFAERFGGKLNEKYDPQYNRDDALTERVLYLYNHHLLD